MSKSTESRTQKPGTQGGLTRRNVLRFAFGAGAAVALSNPLVAFAKPSASKETLNELSDKQEEYEAAMAQLNQISDEYQALSVEADQTKSKIEDILTQIDDTQTQIDDKEQELTAKQDELSERLAADYKGGDQGLLSVLLASTSFEELGSNLFYINKVNDRDQQLIEDVRTVKASLDEHKADLEVQRKEQEDLAAVQQDQLAQMQDKQQQVQDTVNNLDEEVQDLPYRQARQGDRRGHRGRGRAEAPCRGGG